MTRILSVDMDDGLLKTWRRLGVKRILLRENGDPIEVEFFPAAHPPDNTPASRMGVDMGGPEMCPCSHDETQHSNDGLCLLGCSPSMCSVQPKGDAQKAADAP